MFSIRCAVACGADVIIKQGVLGICAAPPRNFNVAVFMTSLITLVRSIPDVVWSAVIASLLTLSGVMISNWGNTSRLRIQLKHDAAEKAKERTAILRREVYLGAAEELTRIDKHLASLPQSDFAQTNLWDKFDGFLAAIAKLQLVAEPKTALLANQLASLYGELGLRLMVRAVPLQKARLEIQIKDDLHKKAQAEVARATEVTRFLTEMAKFNEAARVNEAVLNALKRASEAHQTQANQFAAERDACWKEFNRLAVEFSRQLLMDMRLLGEQQIPLIVEIRSDLGVSAEIAGFREQLEAQCDRMNAEFDATLRNLQD